MSLVLKIAGLLCWLIAAFASLLGAGAVNRVNNLVALGAFLFFLPDVLPL